LVAAFGARGATREGILKAAREGRRKWLRFRAIDYIVRDRSGGGLKVRRIPHGGR
jgi:hypothetical protein